MSDLISRKELIAAITLFIEEFKDRKDPRTNEEFVEEKLREVVRSVIGDVMRIINARPVAFDKEKVIEEFKAITMEELGITKKQFFANQTEYSVYCSICLADAIKIVTKGGIE